jgi:hypothetical protein
MGIFFRLDLSFLGPLLTSFFLEFADRFCLRVDYLGVLSPIFLLSYSVLRGRVTSSMEFVFLCFFLELDSCLVELTN